MQKSNTGHPRKHQIKRRRLYRRLSDFYRFSRFLMIFKNFLEFKKAPGAIDRLKGASEDGKSWDRLTKLSKAPQINSSAIIQERRLPFPKISDFCVFKSKKIVKNRDFPQLQRHREASQAIVSPYGVSHGSKMF